MHELKSTAARRARAARSAVPTAPELIAKKRDGQPLAPDEIRWLVSGFARGEVPDYQMSALAMAVVLRGMSARETAALTLAIRDSGRRAHLRRGGGPAVDKHSTGGVGDKVSICLAPLAAACGLRVPMISGRGLAHTGGTLDKLEAIPGFRVDLPLRRFERQVDELGLAMIGQTHDLAPADRKLYALRDVTATVESIPLITASILGKKLCEDLDALVLDVKVGRELGLRTTAVLTRMDCPLGRAVGNALETREAFELLCGGGPGDLLECTLALGCEMLLAGGLERSAARARARLRAVIASGAAAAKLEALIAAQHGDPRVVREPDRLPRARSVVEVEAPRGGFVAAIDALAIARVAMELGAGRTRVDEPIDVSVGVVLRKKPGERVRRGEALAELHLGSAAQLPAARKAVLGAYTLARRVRRPPPLVLQVMRSR